LLGFYRIVDADRRRISGEKPGMLVKRRLALSYGIADPVVDAALEQQQRIGEEVIGAEKVAPGQ
jgi:hypothetical protein